MSVKKADRQYADPRFYQSDEDRILRRIEKDPVTECWNWQGSRVKGKDGKLGYGIAYGGIINGKQRTKLAHRLSYEIFNGPIEEGLFVCHRCDNKLCVNPKHLFLDTHKGNMKDAQDKGRMNRGENNFFSTLTEQQVREIHAGFKPGQMTIVGYANTLNLPEGTVRCILNGKNWKYLGLTPY